MLHGKVTMRSSTYRGYLEDCIVTYILSLEVVDMTFDMNRKYWFLTPIRQLDEYWNNYRMYECRCDCGNLVKVSSRDLSRGGKRTCGCARVADITDAQIGEYHVIKPNRLENGQVYWDVECSCGRKEVLTRREITRKRACDDCKAVKKNTLIAGRTLGDITVVSLNKTDKHRNTYWNCTCACGIDHVISRERLRKGVKGLPCGCRSTREDWLQLQDDLVQEELMVRNW